jgi:hypothetical protein
MLASASALGGSSRIIAAARFLRSQRGAIRIESDQSAKYIITGVIQRVKLGQSWRDTQT